MIEDDPEVLEMLRRLLEFRGYRTLLAGSGVAGLDIYRGRHCEIQAVITDLRMPDLHGLKVIEELRLINPDARIVVMSGVVGTNPMPADQSGRLVFLPKPMSGDELVRALRSVVGVPSGA